MNDNIENTYIEMDKTVYDFANFYRKLRPQYFSDSKIIYEPLLTKELFENRLELLSTKKLQSAFEDFIFKCAQRLITPNIKPQTGPDGGGDGKVDAETYEVSSDISDKWYVSGGGAAGKEKWAFAISCKKRWKDKIVSDVEKVVGTNREYTRVLCFSNQFIKSSTRFDLEKELSSKYCIGVSIFDGSWCENAVFANGCMDIALECMNFSDEYKNKKEIIGPEDKKRKERLDEIERGILQHIEGLDTGLNTGYIEELRETCILSRGLERPQQETNGRFERAMRECKHYGTPQQMFSLIYDHAWTSLFWHYDIQAMYDDYLKLKELIDRICSVASIEKMINILTNMVNLCRIGLIETDVVKHEISDVEELAGKLEEKGNTPCALYIRLYIAEEQLIERALSKEPTDDAIDAIRELLLEVSRYNMDISFETQYEIIKNLNKLLEDSPKYDDLVYELTTRMAETRSEQEGAEIKADVGKTMMESKKYMQAIRYFSSCLRPFEKEECKSMLIRVSGMMGLAFYEMGLYYSAEAFYVKSVLLLIDSVYNHGNISHLLLISLQKLCEIELMLGRFVMYLNWYELMMVVAQNGNFGESEDFISTNNSHDIIWAWRFSVSNLKDSVISALPDILERNNMFFSSGYLKFVLGYGHELDEEIRKIVTETNLKDLLSSQPIFKKLVCDLNISTRGNVRLQTTVNNCTLYVDYENNCYNQMVAESLLGTFETTFSTIELFEVIATTPEVFVEMVETDGEPELKQKTRSNEYQLCINKNFSGADLWKCYSMFLGYFSCKNSVSNLNILDIFDRKQEKEKHMDMVMEIVQMKQSVSKVLGPTFKNAIEDWQRENDKLYLLKDDTYEYKAHRYINTMQHNMEIYGINTDMNIWNSADWKGCGFAFDKENKMPPMLGLIFNNIDTGRKIISEWREQIMNEEKSIIISMIRGISIEHPCWYRICITPDINIKDKVDNRYCTLMCRDYTMEVENTYFFDCFERFYKQFNCCKLTVFEFGKNPVVNQEDVENAPLFKKVEIKYAWEIGMDDSALYALKPDDDLFIPEEKKDSAPVLQVMENLRKLERGNIR